MRKAALLLCALLLTAAEAAATKRPVPAAVKKDGGALRSLRSKSVTAAESAAGTAVGAACGVGVGRVLRGTMHLLRWTVGSSVPLAVPAALFAAALALLGKLDLVSIRWERLKGLWASFVSCVELGRDEVAATLTDRLDADGNGRLEFRDLVLRFAGKQHAAACGGTGFALGLTVTLLPRPASAASRPLATAIMKAKPSDALVKTKRFAGLVGLAAKEAFGP
jgi:hypothetical protein